MKKTITIFVLMLVLGWTGAGICNNTRINPKLEFWERQTIEAEYVNSNYTKSETTQSVTISGIIKHDSTIKTSPNVFLSNFNLNSHTQAIPVKSDGTFEYTIQITEAILYKLDYKSDFIIFLVTPEENKIQVNIEDHLNNQTSLSIVNSRGNKAYLDYHNEIFRFIDSLTTLRVTCKNNPKGCSVAANRIVKNHNVFLKTLMKDYKGTYIEKFLAEQPRIQDINGKQPAFEQIQKHFFDNFNLADTRTYISKDIPLIISKYIDFLADTSAQARNELFQQLFDKTKQNNDARKELTFVLINSLTRGNKEMFLKTFVDIIEQQKSLIEGNTTAIETIKRIAITMPGKPMTDVTGVDTSGLVQTLSATVKKNKVTLLLFWSPDCGHCQDAIPKLIKLYERNHKDGFDIFAVSMGSEKEIWIDFLRKNLLPWQNITSPTNLMGLYTSYYIQSTPAFVLLDENSNILHRFIRIEDIQGILDHIFSQPGLTEKKIK